VKVHVFVGREFVVEARVLKDDAEAFADFVLVRGGIQTVDFDAAAGGSVQLCQGLGSW
jgi:hypothetical protein